LAYLTKGSYLVQGINIHILCQSNLQFLLSNYFNSLYRGKKRLEIKPLEFELDIVDEPPALPAQSTPVIKLPSITSYRNGEKIYFRSKNGSIISLDPTTRNVRGFLKEEALKDSMELFSLVCAPFVESLKYHGLYSLHSAALYGDEKGYLICGNSGCGKTTIALSLVSQGFKYVSDDFLILEELNGEIIVNSLFRSFNLDQKVAERFPEVALGEALEFSEGNKVSVDVSQIFLGSFVPCTMPDVIIFPRITPNRKSQIHPLNKKDVYARLLKQIILAVDNEVSKKQLGTLEKLVKQTIGFELLSGRDIYEEPRKLVDLLKHINLQN
jgi:hypothetical protein